GGTGPGAGGGGRRVPGPRRSGRGRLGPRGPGGIDRAAGSARLRVPAGGNADPADRRRRGGRARSVSAAAAVARPRRGGVSGTVRGVSRPDGPGRWALGGA